MARLVLEDHDLSLADYSACETDLQARRATLSPAAEVYTTPQGEQRARLAAPAVEFDEGQTSAGDVERVLATHGFRRKAP